ncbi:hypothetical protein VSR69_40895 [Paraburkholderia phytofirmans]
MNDAAASLDGSIPTRIWTPIDFKPESKHGDNSQRPSISWDVSAYG